MLSSEKGLRQNSAIMEHSFINVTFRCKTSFMCMSLASMSEKQGSLRRKLP